MRDLRLAAFGTVCLWATTAEPESLVNWPQFRGTDGAGIADSSVLPTRWSATDKELAKNSVGEMSLATPAADAFGLYVRTLTKHYRLQAPAAKP